jgi:VWFA-related protein
MRRFILVLIGVGAITSTAAQKPAPAPMPNVTFKAISRLVLLDVVVTDLNHQFVSGLTQKDFTILEDGKEQQIVSFEAPAAHPQNPISGSQAPVTIFVLDELNTNFHDMAFAREQLLRYLRRQPEHLQEPSALILIDSTQFKVLHEFSRDREALLEALKKHEPRLPWKLKNGAITDRLARSLVGLQEIAAATMGIPGRKNVIWVGVGFPALNLIGVHEDIKTTIENAVNRTVNRLLEARVSMYPIDPTLMTSARKSAAIDSGDPDTGAFADLDNDPFDTDVNLALFGPATGGRSYHWRNDIADVIQTSIADGSEYYTMAYVPSNRSEDPKFRSIRIKMRPGLIARTRDGYYPIEPPLTKDMVAVDLLQAAENTLSYTGLPISITGKNQGDDAACTLYVDAHALTWQTLPNGDSQTTVRIGMASFSSDGKRLAYDVKEMSSTTPAAKFNALMEQPVSFPVQVQLPRKVARLRFVVRDEATGHMGTVDVDPANIPAVAQVPKPRAGS